MNFEEKLREIQERVCREKGISVDILRRMLQKVEDESGNVRSMRLQDILLELLEQELAAKGAAGSSAGQLRWQVADKDTPNAAANAALKAAPQNQSTEVGHDRSVP